MTKGYDEWDFSIPDNFKAVILENGDLYIQGDDPIIDYFIIKQEFIKKFVEWLKNTNLL